jgi:hypothetical protein
MSDESAEPTSDYERGYTEGERRAALAMLRVIRERLEGEEAEPVNWRLCLITPICLSTFEAGYGLLRRGVYAAGSGGVGIASTVGEAVAARIRPSISAINSRCAPISFSES